MKILSHISFTLRQHRVSVKPVQKQLHEGETAMKGLFENLNTEENGKAIHPMELVKTPNTKLVYKMRP